MKQARWLGMVALLLSLGITFTLKPVRGEFGVGLGDIERPSLEASARFNEALSTFHLMLAALDKKDAKLAMQYRDQADRQFKEAADLYEQASSKADNHILKAIPKTQQEREDLNYFAEHARAFEMNEAMSQKALVVAISRQVARFRVTVEKANLVNLRQQQSVVNAAAELQRFLSSATTVLTIG